MRIIDVNINRATEGLRVVEELCRFVLEDQKLTLSIKKLRVSYPGSLSQSFEAVMPPEMLGKNLIPGTKGEGRTSLMFFMPT